jgi:carbonic anhydrase/acetyltransferase-like protein (isoleucine patch superfamily)
MNKTFESISPQIDKSVYISENSTIIGNTSIDEFSNIWFNVVIRGDVNKITIGKYTNIQDLTMLHVSDSHKLTVGDYVTVGHRAIIHGSTIGNNVLIGMGSIILDGSIIGDNTIVGAGSLVPQNKIYPSNSLIMGTPAKVVRELTIEEIQSIKNSAINYTNLSRKYMEENK